MLKNLLSLAIVVFFILIAIASNKLHYGAFKYDNRVEKEMEKGNYLVKMDGTKLYGKEVKLKGNKILVDGQEFRKKEIRGFLEDSVYYAFNGNYVMRRIVHGKLNVYVLFWYKDNERTARTSYFAQRGEDGPMIAVGGQNGIKKFLYDCPLALQMADLSDKELNKAIKKDPNYMNSIFETYNNDCKALK